MNEAATFRKRPVQVRAIQWTGDNADAVRAFVDRPVYKRGFVDDAGKLWVEKSNAWCDIAVGDWVIAELDGAGVYPCVAAHFGATYEREGE